MMDDPVSITIVVALAATLAATLAVATAADDWLPFVTSVLTGLLVYSALAV